MARHSCAYRYLSNPNASTIVSGVCLKSFVTTSRTAPASSSSGLPTSTFGNVTVTDCRLPLCQLKPTSGFTPVACSRSVATAFEYDRPFELRRATAGQSACENENGDGSANLHAAPNKINFRICLSVLARFSFMRPDAARPRPPFAAIEPPESTGIVDLVEHPIQEVFGRGGRDPCPLKAGGFHPAGAQPGCAFARFPPG
jgi:hypothetical protein